MSASTFALSVLLVLAISAVPALVYAERKGLLSSALVALPFAPAVALYVALTTINGPAQIGFGFILYPFCCIVLCITLLYLLVFVFGRLVVTPLRSRFLLAVVCVGAFVFGAIAAPWYE